MNQVWIFENTYIYTGMLSALKLPLWSSLSTLPGSHTIRIAVVGLALLSQLVVLKLNSNRLGEECTFTLRRMAEKNADPCGCG